MAIVFHVPWYATVFRGDSLEQALAEIAPVALRYGASDYALYRLDDDRYRFIQIATFESKHDSELYWHGHEFVAWRADYSSWYQVPVVYSLEHPGARRRPRARARGQRPPGRRGLGALAAPAVEALEELVRRRGLQERLRAVAVPARTRCSIAATSRRGRGASSLAPASSCSAVRRSLELRARVLDGAEVRPGARPSRVPPVDQVDPSGPRRRCRCRAAASARA